MTGPKLCIEALFLGKSTTDLHNIEKRHNRSARFGKDTTNLGTTQKTQKDTTDLHFLKKKRVRGSGARAPKNSEGRKLSGRPSFRKRAIPKASPSRPETAAKGRGARLLLCNSLPFPLPVGSVGPIACARAQRLHENGDNLHLDKVHFLT